MNDQETLFPHRLNEEGSYDSICRACFATVVRGKAKGELAAYEEAHVCDPIHMLSDLARNCRAHISTTSDALRPGMARWDATVAS